MTNDNKNNALKQHFQEKRGIDFGQIVQRLRKYWYMFLLLPALTGTLAWVYLRYQLPIYEVKSTIIIKDEKNKAGVSASDLISKELGLSTDKKMLVDETKIMTSYSVMEEVVRDLNLNCIVSAKGTVRNEEIYGVECPIRIDSIALKDSLADFNASLYVIDDTTFEMSYAGGSKQTERFGVPFSNEKGVFLINKVASPKYANRKNFVIVCKGIEKAARDVIKTVNIVLPKKESNILEPTMMSAIPQKAKDILQRMLIVYNDHSLGDKKEVSRNTLNLLKSVCRL